MPIESGGQIYYPSAKVSIKIRFEEFAQDNATLKKDVPDSPSKNIKGSSGNRNNLSVVKDTSTYPGITVLNLVSKSAVGKTSGSGSDQEQSADGMSQWVAGIIPRSAQWKLNGFRIADTLSLEIKWQDMPIDPRCVRSASVKFYLGTVKPEDHAQGILGRSRASDGPDSAQPINLVPDRYADPNGHGLRTNLRFEGWIDTWDMSWGSDGEPVIKLECADNTRLFIDQQQPSKGAVDVTKPIDEAVADYLAQFPQFNGITVMYLPGGGTIPKIKDVVGNSAAVPQLGPPASKGGGATGGDQSNVWDYLTDITAIIGHGLRLEGTNIIIQRPSDAIDGRQAPRKDDPYAARQLASGLYENRTFIFGQNIAELAVKRDYTKKKPTNIEVRCFQPGIKNPIVGRFPEKKDRVIHALPGDGQSDEKWTTFRAPSCIKDPVVLKQLAENIFNSIGRQELEVKVKTMNMSSFGGGNADPDILDMRAGDTFEIMVDRNGGNTQTDLQSSLSSEKLCAQFMEKIGYTPEFAKAYAKSVTAGKLQKIYRLKEMNTSWSIDDGVSFELVGVNYITARVDKPSDKTTTDTQTPAKKPPAGNPGKAPVAAAPSIPQLKTPTIPDGYQIIAEGADSVIVQNSAGAKLTLPKVS